MTKGYVYLMGNRAKGIYKIGCSIHPEKRLERLQKTVPFPIELLHSIPADEQGQGEQRLQIHFSQRHFRGEWFALADEDLAEIKRLEFFSDWTFTTLDGGELRF